MRLPTMRAALAATLALHVACAEGEERCLWPDLPDGVQEVVVQPGTFRQGSDSHSDHPEVLPAFDVTITRPFAIMAFEVTRRQWEEFFPAFEYLDPECGPDCPVAHIDWDTTLALANAFSDRDGLPRCYDLEDCIGAVSDGTFWCPDGLPIDLDCPGWRLPTSSEWELAARGGTRTESICSDGIWDRCVLLYTHANDNAYDRVARRSSMAPVGSYCPNAFGVYDAYGNAAEWTWDAVGRGTDNPYCRFDGEVDPLGCPADDGHIVRGNSYTQSGPFSSTVGYGLTKRQTHPLLAQQGVRFVRTVQ